MFRTTRIAALCAAAALVISPVSAGNKDFAIRGYSMPSDKPVTIVLMRPDVQVGLLQAGGLPEPNADWTKAARDNIEHALEANSRARNVEIKVFDPATAEAQQLVGDYESLHRAVAGAILEFAYGSKLPTKKRKRGEHEFDWTMGSGTAKLGALSGGNYALFLYAHDNFASSGRKAMQALGMLGCIVGACIIVSGGQHASYASLVELSTGNVVWFNVQRGSKGDIREEAGAKALIDALLASMPTRAGDPPVAPKPRRR